MPRPTSLQHSQHAHKQPLQTGQIGVARGMSQTLQIRCCLARAAMRQLAKFTASFEPCKSYRNWSCITPLPDLHSRENIWKFPGSTMLSKRGPLPNANPYGTSNATCLRALLLLLHPPLAVPYYLMVSGSS
jgi:hypothetical protein